MLTNQLGRPGGDDDLEEPGEQASIRVFSADDSRAIRKVCKNPE